MDRKTLFLCILSAGFTANLGAQGVPPIFQGMYNQCRSDCMQLVERGTLRGAPSFQAPVNERAGFCGFVCYCTVEQLNANVNLELNVIQNACIAQYTPPAGDTTKLRAQRISQAFREFSWGLANPTEQRTVARHFDEMEQAVAPVLVCVYGTTGISFWYEKVTIHSAKLREIARSHPLLFLGDGALSKCPSTLGEAETKRREFRGTR